MALTLTRSTRSLSAEEARAGRRWYVADADGRVLGRLAARVAHVLRGKAKAGFTPHADAGDFVIVVNAEKIRLTGTKLKTKQYVRHSGYPGGIRQASAEEVLRKHPTRVVRQAVAGMLPKSRLGRHLATKLKVYAGPAHPHGAQKPKPLPETTR